MSTTRKRMMRPIDRDHRDYHEDGDGVTRAGLPRPIGGASSPVPSRGASSSQDDHVSTTGCNSNNYSNSHSEHQGSNNNHNNNCNNNNHDNNDDDAHSRLVRRGTWYATTSLWLLLVATSLTLPHQQSVRDGLHCDSLCYGSLTSAKSTLKLLGATLIGQLSDAPWTRTTTLRRNPRQWCLFLGLLASGVAILTASRAQSIQDLWVATIPLGLEQNVHVLKALLSDYHDVNPHSTWKDRASSVGTLGMVSGLAMMMGPLLGTLGGATYAEATRRSLLLLLGAAVLTARLPTVPRAPRLLRESAVSRRTTTTSMVQRLWRTLDVPSARSPAALVILTCRLLSTLSFYVYQTILTKSLRDRFHFQPRDYGIFFSAIGLFLAVSQGFVAQRIMEGCSDTSQSRVRLLLVCSFLVSACRYWAFETTSLVCLYLLFAVMVTAYGVIATIFAADTSQIAAPEELGRFFGLVAAVEQGAGMVGPLLGGALSYYVHATKAPLLAAVALNAASLLVIASGYERFVTPRLTMNDNQTKKKV